MNCNKKLVAFVVPTGVGASIGGFAGDASLWAGKFATLPGISLIVNPNVVNAAGFSGIRENMLYVEGWALSQFFKGNIFLKPPEKGFLTGNKIGIVFDKKIQQNVLNIHINTVNAVKTVYGIDILGHEITQNDVGIEFFETETGISSGRVNNPEALLSASQKLIEKGARALAIVTRFEEPQENDGYVNGCGVDVVGGVEAVISHYITGKLLVPCAHAPAFDDISIKTDIVDKKVSAEYITPTFLPCVLLGLNHSPLIEAVKSENSFSFKNIRALIMPHNCLGSSIVLDAVEKNIPVFAIKENNTVLNVNKYELNLKSAIIEFNGYEDCFSYLKESM